MAGKKTHFGADTIGVVCKSGMDTAPNMSLNWDEVTCKTCRTRHLDAGELPAEAVQAWLTSRIEQNAKIKARQAEWQQERHDQEMVRRSTEKQVLDALEHDFKLLCPDTFTKRRPASAIPVWRQVTEELMAQRKTSLDMIIVTVRFDYLDSPHEGDVCDVLWKGVYINVWRDEMQELTEVVPADQVIEYWNQGSDAAKQRAIAERDAALAEEDEYEATL